MKIEAIILLCLSSALALIALLLEFEPSPKAVTDPAEIAQLDRAASNLTEWEHGYQTRNVKATRYRNAELGQNIGFLFPGHENNCDRKELVDFMKAHGGWVYQCGGYPGAEMFVKFSGVNDRDAANAKLIEILPELDRLVRTL